MGTNFLVLPNGHLYLDLYFVLRSVLKGTTLVICSESTSFMSQYDKSSKVYNSSLLGSLKWSPRLSYRSYYTVHIDTSFKET